MVVAVHVNPAQPHQVEHGQWLKRGIERHGLKVEVTASPTMPADVHVVSGPHYAKNSWLHHHRTVLLDCAYYHEGRSHWHSTDWVSLGWMRSDGGRRFRVGEGRPVPVIEDRPIEGGTIFLADYGGPIEPADTVRRHPADEAPREPLRTALRKHRRAVGYQTSALVAAALAGLEIVCKDARNIMFARNWLELLPYADWHWTEIESGDAWEHLRREI
jgi:hypothetical protein